jgi:hypothetical protein
MTTPRNARPALVDMVVLFTLSVGATCVIGREVSFRAVIGREVSFRAVIGRILCTFSYKQREVKVLCTTLLLVTK